MVGFGDKYKERQYAPLCLRHQTGREVCQKANH